MFTVNSGGIGSTINGFIITSNGLNDTDGIILNNTNNCKIVKNNITTNMGIGVVDGSNNTISGNIINSGNLAESTGIVIADNKTISSNNTIINNKIKAIMGIFAGGSDNTIYLNTINSATNSVVKSTGILLFNVVQNNNTTLPSNNNVIIGNNITADYTGIIVVGSNNTISENNINPGTLMDTMGISIGGNNTVSSNNTITKNNITNDYIGIAINNASKNVISQNIVNSTPNSAGNSMGIMLINSTNSTISTNTITTIGSNGTAVGLVIMNSPKIISSGNNIKSSSGSYSLGLEIENSMQNTIIGNSISSGLMGIIVGNSTNAVINFNRIIASKAIINSDPAFLNALYNWYGSNSKPSNEIVGNVTYAPWLVLTITANPNNTVTGSKSIITADLKHDSNGGVHNTTYVINGLTINFCNVTLGIVNPTSGKTINGMVNTTYTAGSTAGPGKVSAKVDNQTVSTNITVGLTINQLISASAYVKNYYETNHNLPSNITISSQTITMPTLLQYLVMATININAGNINSLTSVPVNPPLNQSGTFTSGNIQKSEYLSTAAGIKSYIITNARAPNNMNTSLGVIPFAKLVYMYSKIINFYGINNQLPNYVSMTP